MPLDAYSAHLLETDPDFRRAWNGLARPDNERDRARQAAAGCRARLAQRNGPRASQPPAAAPVPPPTNARSNAAIRVHYDRIIIAYLRQHGTGTARDFSTAGITRGSVDDVIERLLREGVIKHVGQEKHFTSWAKVFALTPNNTDYQDTEETH